MLIGGGPTVAVAMLFTMANDISTDDQRQVVLLIEYSYVLLTLILEQLPSYTSA